MKTSVSIKEMGDMLGLRKTEAYRLANSGVFSVVEIGKRKRVLIESFENWYENQSLYQKVIETNQPVYYSISEVAERLAISYTTAYDLTIKDNYQAEKYGNHWRIDVESFEIWLQKNPEYCKKRNKKWITVKDISGIIGVACADARAMVYNNNIVYKKYKNGQILVNAESFNQWYVEYLEELSYQENPWVLDAPKEEK